MQCTICFLVSAFLSCSMFTTLTAFGAEARPNVVYIMADELGYYEPGFNGGTTIQTPNLDRMAADGMRFKNLFAGSAVCARRAQRCRCASQEDQRAHHPRRWGIGWNCNVKHLQVQMPPGALKLAIGCKGEPHKHDIKVIRHPALSKKVAQKNENAALKRKAQTSI